MIDPGVVQVTGTVVPGLPIVGVLISRRPSTAHWSNETMSLVFSDSGMGSWRVGSAIPSMGVVASGWRVNADGVAGEGIARGGACWLAGSNSGSDTDTDTRSGYCLDGLHFSLCSPSWRSAHSSLRSFSIFPL